MLTLAFIVATAIPLLSLYVIYRLDRYATRTFRNVLVCFAWGIVATRVALLLNTVALDSGLLDASTVARVVAPVIEEIVKALLIVYLVRRRHFTYFVDGAIYGFAVGIGFAVVENYFYLLNNQDAALSLAVGRVLSTNLMHASTTAVAGIALGLGRFQPTRRRAVAISLAGLGAASAMHMVFNTMVTRYIGSTAVLYVLAAAYGLAGALLVAGAIRFGLRRARGWMETSLSATERVTRGETEKVGQLDQRDQVLRPIAQRFGQETADNVEALLLMQARLGILLRNANELPDGAPRRKVEQEIGRVQSEMDELRLAIGVYAMVHVRFIAPEAAGSPWQMVELARAGLTGDDMYSRTTARLRPQESVWARVGLRQRPWLTVASYLALTAALWLLPLTLDTTVWLTDQQRTLLQIALQWLLTLGVLDVLSRPGPSVFGIAALRLEAAGPGHRLHRRLLGKTGRLLALAVGVAVSAAIWLGPSFVTGTPAAGDPALVASQLLAQGAVLLTAALVLGKLRLAMWLATMAAIGMAIAVLLQP